MLHAPTELFKKFIVKIVVNDKFYLQNHLDVAAARVEPKKHYRDNWNKTPLRAPNAKLERWFFASSPFIVWGQALRGRVNRDWLSIFRVRITDVSYGNMPIRQRIAMLVAQRITQDVRTKAHPDLIEVIGRARNVTRTWSETRSCLETFQVEESEACTFKDVRPVGSKGGGKSRVIMLPALRHTIIKNAVIFGTAQILAEDSFIVDEQAADPIFSFTAGQMHACIAADPSGKSVIVKDQHAQGDLPEGILINGRCAKNYYHFLIEYLSKGYILEKVPLSNDLPLITTDDLYSTQYEALKIVFPDRNLYLRPAAGAVRVGTLHLPSIMTYMPDAPEVPGWKKAGFRPSSLNWLRTQVFRGLAIDPRLVPGKRIYLRRTAGRLILNTPEVERVLGSFGFVPVDPAALSFAEQVELFSSAECIAGMLGAAFSNVVFCAAGAKIIGFGPRHAVSSIFQNLSHLNGCQYYLFPGKVSLFDSAKSRVPFLNDAHASFTIDTGKLINFLAATCK